MLARSVVHTGHVRTGYTYWEAGGGHIHHGREGGIYPGWWIALPPSLPDTNKRGERAKEASFSSETGGKGGEKELKPALKRGITGEKELKPALNQGITERKGAKTRLKPGEREAKEASFLAQQ